VVPTGNNLYEAALAPYFGKGYPIFGANAKGAELELDRELGQRVLEEHGVQVVPYHIVKDIDEALGIVSETRKAYAIKPWGGTTDKALTCVARGTGIVLQDMGDPTMDRVLVADTYARPPK